MKKSLLSVIMLMFITNIVGAQTVVNVAPDTWTSAELTQYVGQTVTFSQPFYICNNYYFSSGTYYISPRRVFAPTNQALPLSDEYEDIISLNKNAEVQLTGLNEYHRCGERFENLTAKVISQTRLQLEGEPTISGNTRDDMLTPPNVDMRGEHTLLVCGFNLEYYLVENLGTGYGPDNQTQSDLQHTKIMDALTAIQADIFGLVEIEQGQSALQKIAQSLTDSLGVTYSYINDGGSSYGSYTKSGYVYRTDKVQPIGTLVNNNTGVSNRKKIQQFKELSSDSILSFSINHFKAKSGNATGRNADQNDGQGKYNYDRIQEAKSVIAYKQQFHNMLVMGDLNAYAKEDPITEFTNNNFEDLHRAFHADSSYSYVFRDQAGYLDHALADELLKKHITGMAAYHINSDEHDGYTYDGTYAQPNRFRCSDHDPILVGINLSEFYEPLNSQPYITNLIEPVIYNANGGYCKIITPFGHVVAQENITNDEYRPTYPANAGLYILILYADKKIQTHKFIIR